MMLITTVLRRLRRLFRRRHHLPLTASVYVRTETPWGPVWRLVEQPLVMLDP